jgi:flagellar hook-associated protein 3 FlgL
MTRVATVPLQQVMSGAIQRSQEKLAITQQQLASGKKAANFADLGTETVRNLSAHSMLSRQDAQSAVSKRVGTTLSLYQANIESVETAATDLKQSILDAVGTGKSAGLQEAIQTAFDQYRTALNAGEGGTPLFGGSQTEGVPFSPNTLSDVAGTTADAAFSDDGVLATARVADGVDVTYGVSASSLGKDLYAVFRTLAQAGTIGEEPTDAQMDALKSAVAQLKTGITSVQTVNAENGRKQAQVDTLADRGDQRSLLLKGVIQDNEDADLGQVAIDLTAQQTILQASYSVFAKLATLSLANFLN